MVISVDKMLKDVGHTGEKINNLEEGLGKIGYKSKTNNADEFLKKMECEEPKDKFPDREERKKLKAEKGKVKDKEFHEVMKNIDSMPNEIEKPEKKEEPQITHSWECPSCGTFQYNETGITPPKCSCGRKGELKYYGYKYRQDLIDEALEKFKREDVFEMIKVETSKKHLGDDNLKMTMMLVDTSGLLKDQRQRMSMAVKAGSSEGKDNLIKAILDNMPNEAHLFLTKGTTATIEDDIDKIRILGLSEMNMNREGGANKDLVETIKQRTEGGTHSMKKNIEDNMKSVKFSKCEQGTVVFGTTETEMTEEMQTRFICGGMKSTPESNKMVMDYTCDNVSKIDRVVDTAESPDNWIRIGLATFHNKEEQFYIVLPYGEFLKEKINGKYLFDYSTARGRRDIKRIFALTSAMTYLYQEQREITEYDGNKVLVSTPEDFVKTLEISQEFFNQSYTGLDSRLTNVLNTMKDLEKSEGCEWVARKDVEKVTGKDRNTIKGYFVTLAGEGLVEGCNGETLMGRGVGGSFKKDKIYFKREDIEKIPLIQQSQLTLLKEHLEKKMANSEQ